MKTSAEFPELLQRFFIDRLGRERHASAHTIASYRDTVRLLMNFAIQRLDKQPCQVTIADLDAPFIGSFLNHLEKDRRISARSRNVRLSAIHSFFRYVAMNEPSHMMVAQRVLAMPTKRFDRRPQLTSSVGPKSTPCWPLLIDRLGAADEITSYCSLQFRRVFGFQNSLIYAVKILFWAFLASVLTCAAAAKDARKDLHLCERKRRLPSGVGFAKGPAAPMTFCFRTREAES